MSWLLSQQTFSGSSSRFPGGAAQRRILTVSGSSVRANSESLALTALLNRAQPLRTRIESWRQTLPLLSTPVSELGEDDFDNGAALRLSHLTLEIMIFRALLRPLAYDAAASAERCQEPISTIFENCYVCANVATDIVSSLRAKHFASFWPHCECSHHTMIALVTNKVFPQTSDTSCATCLASSC